MGYYRDVIMTLANPRIIAWEVTRRCPLACKHCRAGACDVAYDGELTTDECLRVIDSLYGVRGLAPAFCEGGFPLRGAYSPRNEPQCVSSGASSLDESGSKLPHSIRPMLIWTGGEPMSRPDILELVRHATARGIRSVMAPCGMMVTKESLFALKEAGIMACSFSLDGATAATHDAFRGVEGAFDIVTRAMDVAVSVGMPFQVNCTVSQLNRAELPAIRDIAIARGAKTMDLFFLVPVGRGRNLRDVSLSPDETEEVLHWMFEMEGKGGLRMRETCAPQAVRIWAQLSSRIESRRHDSIRLDNKEKSPPPAGCLGGKSFVFISHTGILQPCGFLDVPSGDLREHGFDFRRAYEASPVFKDLRNPDNYGGTCGICKFRADCGGCRARAYAATGDYMATETSCPLNAQGKKKVAL